MDYKQSREIIFLLDNGEFAFPVQMKSTKTGNCSFRSAPQSENVLGTDWDENEVEVSEEQMVKDILINGRRTRSVSASKTEPSLRGKNSKDVAAVYVRVE
jgi:hypothetical protein